jgi:hypothetical protein
MATESTEEHGKTSSGYCSPPVNIDEIACRDCNIACRGRIMRFLPIRVKDTLQ